MRRVTAYTIPVIFISILINVPKFMETKIVVDMAQDADSEATIYNITTYTIDVTELRLVLARNIIHYVVIL
jgi:hypothetical protein